MSRTIGKPFKCELEEFDGFGMSSVEASVQWDYSHSSDIMRVTAMFPDGRVEELFIGGPLTMAAVKRALDEEAKT